MLLKPQALKINKTGSTFCWSSFCILLNKNRCWNRLDFLRLIILLFFKLRRVFCKQVTKRSRTHYCSLDVRVSITSFGSREISFPTIFEIIKQRKKQITPININICAYRGIILLTAASSSKNFALINK